MKFHLKDYIASSRLSLSLERSLVFFATARNTTIADVEKTSPILEDVNYSCKLEPINGFTVAASFPEVLSGQVGALSSQFGAFILKIYFFR